MVAKVRLLAFTLKFTPDRSWASVRNLGNRQASDSFYLGKVTESSHFAS